MQLRVAKTAQNIKLQRDQREVEHEDCLSDFDAHQHFKVSPRFCRFHKFYCISLSNAVKIKRGNEFEVIGICFGQEKKD